MSHEDEPWFHKGISAHDAIDMLEQKPNGSFLFRPSSSAGFLSLSYKGVRGDDSIHHIRVQVVNGKFITDGDPKRYDSLALLVKARNSILMKPVYAATGGYSGPALNENDITNLMQMGFGRPEAIVALQQKNGSVEQALDTLMNGGIDAAAAAAAVAAGPAGGSKPQGIPGPIPQIAATHLGHGTARATVGIPGGLLHGPVGCTDDQNKKNKNYMEDGFVMVPNLGPHAYFAVYDGHSGREAVEYTQLMLHNNLLALLQQGSTPQAAFLRSYNVTDDELLARGIKKAGATSVSILLSKEGNQKVLHCANAGDGRAVLCRGGKAVRISFDHKVEVASETQRIVAAGGTILWGRVQGQTMVSRSLGDHDLKKYVISDPYYSRTVLDPSCQFVIVACDGIWDVAEDQEAVDCVKNIRDPQQASMALIQFVLDKGTKDNLTAMVVML